MGGRGGWLAGMVACAAVVFLAVSSAYGPPSPRFTPTGASVPGTCHVAVDPEELSATISDTAPLVPCNEPHQTETVWTQEISGFLGRQADRPNPELLIATFAATCNDYGRLRSYLGADGNDSNWGLEVLVKVPTPTEWAGGARTLRCDAAPGEAGPRGPVLDQSLNGVLRRADSSGFRLCRRDGAPLTCDQAHDAEAVSPDVVLADGPWPGEAAVAAMATAGCNPIVQQYLAGPLTSRPDLRVTFSAPTQEGWTGGNRSADCFVSGPPGLLSVGTVRGGLR